VVNPDYATGQSTSLRAGVAALPAQAEAALILLGDQPLVSPKLIDDVVARWRAAGTGEAIVQARYGQVGAPPVLFGRWYFAEVAGIEGDLGARELVRVHRDHVMAVDTAEDEPFDVDTAEDHQRLIDRWSARRS
jgi:CTP:molybdopterin cytidylyltransferase MocA